MSGRCPKCNYPGEPGALCDGRAMFYGEYDPKRPCGGCRWVEAKGEYEPLPSYADLLSALLHLAANALKRRKVDARRRSRR